MPTLHVLRRLSQRLARSAPLRRSAMFGVDVCAFLAAGLFAFLLRFEFSIPPSELAHLAYAVSLWACAKILAFRLFQMHRVGWRYVSIHDVFRLGFANLAGSGMAAAIIIAFVPHGFPRSIYFLDFFICLIATAGNRFVARLLLEFLALGKQTPGQRTVIYGEGDAGVLLLRETRTNPSLGYSICGFIDDDPGKRSQRVQGVPVLGAGRDLAQLAGKYHIQQVLIAIPSATGPQMTQILEYCHAAGLPCKTIPGMAEVIEQNGLAGQIRDVSVEDLLGRTPIRLDESGLHNKLEGKVVVVTGAAGSIGSELCRQIARFHPRSIVGFDMSETALFYLDAEMREKFPGIPFHPEIGSVQNRCRISEVLERYRPSILYHAAAYKHVPMMEAHVFEAIENNVFGTYTAASAAAEYGLTDFVMISTDKAVHPTSMMGATKRLAELVVHSLQNDSTAFVSVRFGNVLGSNGSVIPIFKKQIAAGGPVTITHPEMRRFFMTIPEAVQLVLQASTMGKGGEIFVLDMGQPVKIMDLARNLILLSGLRPGEDIEIRISGQRPGEKLYEELSTLEEGTLPTYHEKIKIFAGNSLAESSMRSYLTALREICNARSHTRLVLTLKEIIPDYNPSTLVLRRALQDRPAPREAAASA